MEQFLASTVCQLFAQVPGWWWVAWHWPEQKVFVRWHHDIDLKKYNLFSGLVQLGPRTPAIMSGMGNGFQMAPSGCSALGLGTWLRQLNGQLVKRMLSRQQWLTTYNARRVVLAWRGTCVYGRLLNLIPDPLTIHWLFLMWAGKK